MFLGNGLLTMHREDDFWRERRRASQPALQPGALAGYAEAWIPTTEQFLERWESYLVSGEDFDVYSEFYTLTAELAGMRQLWRNGGRRAETDLRHLSQRILPPQNPD